MSGEKTPGQVFRETLHDRWAAQGRCIDSRPYDQLPEGDREDLEASVLAAVDHWRVAGDGDERLPDEEPEPAKVIVVTENLGGAIRECRYTAAMWGCQKDGSLSVGFEHGETGGVPTMLGVGSYAPGAWLAVREEGSIASDGPADKRKLVIALAALREIDQDEDSNSKARSLAEDALADIADVDL